MRTPQLALAAIFAVTVVAGAVGCGGAPDDGTGAGASGAMAKGATPRVEAVRGSLRFDKLTATEASGTFDFRGMAVGFKTEALETTRETTVTMRGMTLLFTTSSTTGGFDVDGYDTASGEPTAMTQPDRIVLHALEVALTDVYQLKGNELPALDALNKNITLLAQYPDTVPLQRLFVGKFDRDASGGTYLCDRVNKPGQGQVKLWTRGTHDCLSGSCGHSWWNPGCNNGDDNSTVDNVFMSMHPSGSCGDSTFFGTYDGNFSCYEPNHRGDVEFTYGACMGRCGATCGGGTQFTKACLDHDVCVSFGHGSISPDCDDDFCGAAWDYTWAPNCGGNFTVHYNWAGSGSQGNCPTGWNGTNDGCDVGCQFVDSDCFR